MFSCLFFYGFFFLIVLCVMQGRTLTTTIGNSSNSSCSSMGPFCVAISLGIISLIIIRVLYVIYRSSQPRRDMSTLQPLCTLIVMGSGELINFVIVVIVIRLGVVPLMFELILTNFLLLLFIKHEMQVVTRQRCLICYLCFRNIGLSQGITLLLPRII